MEAEALATEDCRVDGNAQSLDELAYRTSTEHRRTAILLDCPSAERLRDKICLPRGPMMDES